MFYVIKAYLSNLKKDFVSQIFVKLLKSLTTFFNGPRNHTHQLLQVNVFTVNVTCTDKSLYRRKSSNDWSYVACAYFLYSDFFLYWKFGSSIDQTYVPCHFFIWHWSFSSEVQTTWIFRARCILIFYTSNLFLKYVGLNINTGL